jgi:hypothetical protein
MIVFLLHYAGASHAILLFVPWMIDCLASFDIRVVVSQNVKKLQRGRK